MNVWCRSMVNALQRTDMWTSDRIKADNLRILSRLNTRNSERHATAAS